MILLDWNNPMTWSTSQVANIINFFIAVGTLGTLYLLYQEMQRNRKRMDALERQNELTQQQIKLDNAPDLIVIDFIANDVFVEFRLLNRGRTATVTSVKGFDSFKWNEIKLPVQLQKEECLYFQAIHKSSTSQTLGTPNFLFLQYTDIHEHRYECRVSLEKTRVDLWITELK